MKRLMNFSMIAWSPALFVSCAEETCIGDTPPKCRIVNDSGHTVSIVQKPSCLEMPDSLVLLSGESFFFESETPYPNHDNIDRQFFFYTGFKTRSVYFEGRYVLDFDDLPLNRMFHYTSSYFWTDPNRNIGIFTFTEEDYRYAVAHGTHLETDRK